MDEIDSCFDKIKDKRNYDYLRAVILGRTATPFEIATIFSQNVHLFTKRKLLGKYYDNRLSYLYPLPNDNSIDKGLNIIVDKESGAITNFIFDDGINASAAGRFDKNGRLNLLLKVSPKGLDCMTKVLIDYDQNLIQIVDINHSNEKIIATYKLNDDGTLNKI